MPVKDEVDVTREDIRDKHLILFGDPGSNTLIAQTLGPLPMQWTREKIGIGDKQVSAADHVPVMIDIAL